MNSITDKIKRVLSFSAKLKYYLCTGALVIILFAQCVVPILGIGIENYLSSEVSSISENDAQDIRSKVDKYSTLLEKLSIAAYAVILVTLLSYCERQEKSKIVTCDKLEKCLNKVFGAVKGHIKSLDIYAYSAKNYIAYIKSNSEQIKEIKKVRLLLCRANEVRAWQSHKSEEINAYYKELNEVITYFETRGKREKIKKWEIRYIDDRPLCHFCIVNDTYVISGPMPLNKTEEKPDPHATDCYVIPADTGDVVQGYIRMFSSWFNKGFYDSGLKERSPTCPACVKIIQEGIEQNNRTESYYDFRNLPLLNQNTGGLDFYLLPDSRPISKLHVLLMCKYHVLNLYDYLKRIQTKDGQCKTNDALMYLISLIRRGVKEAIGKEEDIIIFEHGSMNPWTKKKHSSIDHMHLHVILKPKLKPEINVQTIIQEDSIRLLKAHQQSVVEWGNNQNQPLFRRYHDLNAFANDPQMRNGIDYFLIWDLSKSESKDDDPILVYSMQQTDKRSKLKQSDVHQYLRRVFFHALDASERNSLYPDAIIKNYAKQKDLKNFEVAKCRENIWRNDDVVIEIPPDIRKSYTTFSKKLNELIAGKVLH